MLLVAEPITKVRISCTVHVLLYFFLDKCCVRHNPLARVKVFLLINAKRLAGRPAGLPAFCAQERSSSVCDSCDATLTTQRYRLRTRARHVLLAEVGTPTHISAFQG